MALQRMPECGSMPERRRMKQPALELNSTADQTNRPVAALRVRASLTCWRASFGSLGSEYLARRFHPQYFLAKTGVT
eukprot:COSAG01_NODE_2593_length_7405_cov_4.302217_2_plen_77_part_00